jgi:hypothetical protein
MNTIWHREGLSSFNPLDSFSGGIQFKPRPRHQLSWRIPWFLSVLPDKFRDITPITSLGFPSKFPPIHYRSSYHWILAILDTDITSKWPTENNVNRSMQQGPSLGYCSRTASQDIASRLCHLKIHLCAPNNPPLLIILRQINPFSALTHNSFEIQIESILCALIQWISESVREHNVITLIWKHSLQIDRSWQTS